MEERYQEKKNDRIDKSGKDFKFDYLYNKNEHRKKNLGDSSFKNNNLSGKNKKENFKNKNRNSYNKKNSKDNNKQKKSKKILIKKKSKISEEINYYDNDSNLEFISNNFKNINSKLIKNNIKIQNSENNSKISNSEMNNNNSEIKNSQFQKNSEIENSELNNNSEYEDNIYENSGYYNNLNYDKEIEIENGKNEILKNNLNYPIMIDNDIEKFRIRLDSMLNKFKLESISEILKTKKNLLIDQSKFLSNEKKGFNMEIERLITEINNEKKKVKFLEKKDKDNKIKILKLSKKLGDKTNFIKKVPILSQIFYFWKNSKQFTKLKRQKKKISLYFRKKKLSTKFFLNLKKIFYKNKLKKDLKDFENKKAMDFNSIIFKLNNNNNQLKKKIHELQTDLQNSLKNKQNLQKKIQEAFIKGINTINLETMTALDIPKSKNLSKTSIDNKIDNIFLNTDVFQNTEKNIFSNNKGYDFINRNEKIDKTEKNIFSNNKGYDFIDCNENSYEGNFRNSEKMNFKERNQKFHFQDCDKKSDFRNVNQNFNYENNKFDNFDRYERNRNQNFNGNYNKDINFDNEKNSDLNDFESNTFFEANLQSKESLWKKAPILKNKVSELKEKILEYDI